MDKKHKQWEQKVAEFHNRILARLKCDEHVAIFQYKDLYFRIFREAYESGFCTPFPTGSTMMCDQEGGGKGYV